MLIRGSTPVKEFALSGKEKMPLVRQFAVQSQKPGIRRTDGQSISAEFQRKTVATWAHERIGSTSVSDKTGAAH
jgi:hypothetical protein